MLLCSGFESCAMPCCIFSLLRPLLCCAAIMWTENIAAMNALEHALARNTEIPGIDNQAAGILINDAHTCYEQTNTEIEELWKKESSCSHELEAAYKKLVWAALTMPRLSFKYYAWEQQPQRFQDLHINYNTHIASLHLYYCAIDCHKTVEDVNKDYALTLEEAERKKYMINLKIRAPGTRLRHTIFFPATPKMMLARNTFVMSHELGHILYQYKAKHINVVCKASTLPPFITRYVGLALFPFIAHIIAPHVIEHHPRLFLSTWLGMAMTALASLDVTCERQRRTSNEYQADVASLLLMPKSLRYGSIAWFTEALCDQYHFYATMRKKLTLAHRCWLGLTGVIKRTVFSDYEIHPPHALRMLRIGKLLLRATPHDSRQAVLRQLEDVAAQTCKNYADQHDDPFANTSVIRAQRDIEEVFRELRDYFNL